MFNFIDELLDRITMYRLLLYYLIALLLIAIGLSATGVLHYNPFTIAWYSIYLVVVCWIVNQIFARFLGLAINSDSTYITALILALIVSPSFNQDNFTFITAAAGLAIASKYLITYRKKHIFNPAAIAVVLTALGPEQSASWWVGNSAMMPFVIIGGILLVRRIRRGAMVSSFVAAALVGVTFSAIIHHAGVMTSLNHAVYSSALWFLAFVMLTEPLTAPTTKKYQIWYGILTGLLFPPQVHFGSIYSTPERALIVGNVFAFIVNPKVKLFPALVRKIKITPDSLDFVFAPDRKFAYQPGQYMEFTLPHDQIDSRGQRRYFTLASSPTEDTVRIGVKFYRDGSSFKEAMLDMDRNTPIIVNSLGGDFVLPDDRSRKIVLIAGGIGVTPYRSMIKYLLDKNERRRLTLLYAASTPEDIAYADVFEEARERLGVKTLYVVSKSDTLPDNRFRAGYITPELLQAEVPDYNERLFYISGPHAMVVNVEKNLKHLGVPSHNIKTDFFSGYA
jgi:glycine betaine catabolism B